MAGLVLTATDRTTTIREDVVERVAELVQGAALVVLETTARLHDGPEQNEGLSVFARALEDIATGCAPRRAPPGARDTGAASVRPHVSAPPDEESRPPRGDRLR